MMAVIKLLTGTTEDYKAVESTLILDEREIAVEVVTSGEKKYYNIRQGDGRSQFFKLPIIVNNQRFEEINTNIAEYKDAISNFKETMTEATAAATKAAGDANAAAVKAQGEAEKIDSLTEGFNSMTDDETGTTYVMGVENGVIYLEEKPKV